MRFDHTGIIVPDLATGRDHFSKIYNIHEWTREFFDEVNGVYVQFCRENHGMCYELVAPIDNKSPVYSALNNKINTINHIAYIVHDINTSSSYLENNGFISLGEPKRAIAYNMKKIQFFYSKNFNYLLETIDSPSHSHTYNEFKFV